MYVEDGNIGAVLGEIEREYRGCTEGGRNASYIPELANVDSSLFSISATTTRGEICTCGDGRSRFSMQSISKVVALAYACEKFGADEVFSRVGMEPCAEPFNSIMKLEIASNIPLNPFINSGAIAIASLIMERLDVGSLSSVLTFASRMAGRSDDDGMTVNGKIYRSEAATADRNRALAYFMRSAGSLSLDVEEVLDLYFKMCSIEVSTGDLSIVGATIANGGQNPVTGERVVSRATSQILIGLMTTCGLYNESGEFAVKVGIPGKSGVCGGILCAVPGRMGVAVFSPPLDERGNSVAGVKALIALSERMNLRGM